AGQVDTGVQRISGYDRDGRCAVVVSDQAETRVLVGGESGYAHVARLPATRRREDTGVCPASAVQLELHRDVTRIDRLVVECGCGTEQEIAQFADRCVVQPGQDRPLDVVDAGGELGVPRPPAGCELDASRPPVGRVGPAFDESGRLEVVDQVRHDSAVDADALGHRGLRAAGAAR